MLLIECRIKGQVQKTSSTDKYAFSKGNYKELRNSLSNVSWDELLHPYEDNIDDMWYNQH